MLQHEDRRCTAGAGSGGKRQNRSHLDDQLHGGLERDVVLVVLLQDVLSALVVGANGCGLPPACAPVALLPRPRAAHAAAVVAGAPH